MTGQLSTVHSLFDAIDAVWPFAAAEEWDSVGLVTGRSDQPIRRVLLVVDVTEATVTEALSGSFDAIVAHHPLLFSGITSVAETTSKGHLVSQLIRANCALISAHTNADKPRDGVADVFAKRLGLLDTQPIVPDGRDEESGIGRVGMLTHPMTAHELAQQLAVLLPATVTGVRLAGPPNAAVRRVALCPGAGDSLLEHPLVRSADAFITSDLRHHPASESRELSLARGQGPVLLDVSHWASEWMWLDRAAEILRTRLPDVIFEVSALRTDAWTEAITHEEREGQTA